MSKKNRPLKRPEQSRSAFEEYSVAGVGWRTHLGVVCTLAIVTALLYFSALHAPWYMDDTPAIVRNPAIRDLGGSFGNIFLPRGIALFSFALNYRFGGFDPFGYHLVNLALHVACGLLVYLLLRRVVREGVLLPALGALLFIAHPLQTQAVTYVVQRMTVLAALFFFLSLYLFVRARERLASGVPFASAGHLGYYLGALLAGLCAVFTKENTAVLPVALYLFVVVFLPPAGDRKRLLLSLLPFAAGPLALAMVRLFIPLASGETLAGITSATKLAKISHLTPLHYLVTEFSVLWVYIRMFFLPYGQALDHDYPVAASLFELRHVAAGVGLLLLGALAVRLRHRQPLIAAGIAWFFLTLAVESSFIPLDPLFEHRLYLPMFGFVLVLLGLPRLLPDRRAGVALLAVLVLICLPLTWQRNRLWADPVAFYCDNLAKVPLSATVLSDLAAKYFEAGRFAEAEPLLLRALERDPNYLLACLNLLDVYIAQGRVPEAFTLTQQALVKNPRSVQLLTGLGILFDMSGDGRRALQYLDQALAINPAYTMALTYRAEIFARMGRLTEAEAELRRSIEIDPEDRNALFLLGQLAIDRGDRQQAAVLAERLHRRDPQGARELEQRIRDGH